MARLIDEALDDAVSHAPASAEVEYRRGAIAFARGNAAEARARFLAGLARSPDDPRLLAGIVRAIDRELAQKTAPVGAESIRSNAARRLERSARTPDQLRMVTMALLLRGDLEEALRVADRSVAIDRGYFLSYAFRAEVHFTAHRYADAVADQERAISLMREGATSRLLVERLAAYRRAMANAESPTGPARREVDLPGRSSPL
jgi:tetratricopeptide (TPR) repeat protein